MSMEWLRDALVAVGEGEAIIEGDAVYTYPQLVAGVDAMRDRFRAWGMKRGDVLAFAGDYSELGVTRFFAALLEGLVAVPLAMSADGELKTALQAVPVDWFLPATGGAEVPPERRQPEGQRSSHALLETLRARDHAGLIILTSGSTGVPKVILHDVEPLLERFKRARRPYRALVFLLPDHIGGVNTLFSMLTCGSTAILPPSREPDVVCELVQRHRADLLPVTPSFLNLILMSEAWRRFDLSSLKVISYGTEPMPEATLARAVEVFPEVRFVQLYGTSELGIFRSRSESNLSPWIQLKGDGVAEFRIVDGRLWVKGADTMLGYLGGQPSGFDDTGWYDTGDLVEEKDGYVRILGRASELINVGGQKVLPQEVEAVLQELDEVIDAAVFSEPNVLTGRAVVARVQLASDETPKAFKRRMRKALRGRIEPFKIPVRVEVTSQPLVSRRFKKRRR